MHVKIKEYLDRVSIVSDSKALLLLKNSTKILQTQNLVDDKIAEILNNINETLKTIQQSLTRIKRNEIISLSYVAAAAEQGRNELAFLKNQNIKPQQTRKNKAFTLKKKRDMLEKSSFTSRKMRTRKK